jgi:hypothetical protein
MNSPRLPLDNFYLIPLPPSLLFDLIPRPLLPREKGCKNLSIRFLAPLPWERGRGEVERKAERGPVGKFVGLRDYLIETIASTGQ